ncbi:gluconate 2-dehydrogenase subunit 3 family protein [Stenotrophomonas tumulicola]|uniref:Gluconate 2-dehydrogenase subunit 3 family protein n=1 Tax=Stenotrophomonas tumulicola TaxID=1685415 RepID=A0A7W3IGH3_9GAMM|nr:gluconate 2-dehydrogenase subunit 3 family protein [Stenotrophomonas tumulicola]MBA8680915.1 gluconate 2-dehydrogenase subunit 3 family protein [Stenotrophomonas tumulicola]
MSTHNNEGSASPSRRRFFQALTLVPVVAALPACQPSAQEKNAAAGAGKDNTAYVPDFFNEAEWAFVLAACDRLIPADDIGPGAVESGVPEFLDRHMQTPYASGDIWYMQGPFLEAPSEFGYQGRLALRDILKVGIASMDAHCRKAFDGKTFAALDVEQQETLLSQAEGGKLGLQDIADKVFFSNFLNEVKNGYFADPKHGGNKDMGAWKMIGYPGMRADYIDWISVRDKPYPLGPVDLAGRRG